MLGAFAISQILGSELEARRGWKINVSSSLSYQIDVIFDARSLKQSNDGICPSSNCCYGQFFVIRSRLDRRTIKIKSVEKQ